MSTLVEELEEEISAATCTDPACLRRDKPCSRNQLAARLRKRVEHIKALRADLLAQMQGGSESAAVALLGIERATVDLP